jgi:uncharacterized protein YodC (DUF2158 family)
MTIRKRIFQLKDLHIIKTAEDFHDAREPPLRLGNWVCLNSGGPIMTVVDIEGGEVTVAWRTKDGHTRESDFPAACLRRYHPQSVQSST